MYSKDQEDKEYKELVELLDTIDVPQYDEDSEEIPLSNMIY